MIKLLLQVKVRLLVDSTIRTYATEEDNKRKASDK